MAIQRLGRIMHGVTGRMGMNQHLIRSIVAIRQQGGVALGNGDAVMPDPILIGRNAEKIAALAQACHVGYAPHVGWSGAVCVAASLQLAAAMPAFVSFECMFIGNPLRDALCTQPVGSAASLVDGQLPVPQGPGLGVEIDMDAAVSLREQVQEAEDVKVSYNDLVVKACAKALTRFPAVNASWRNGWWSAAWKYRPTPSSSPSCEVSRQTSSRSRPNRSR